MNNKPTGWRKSNRSGQKTACVEVGRLGNGAAVRDTKNPDQGYFIANGDQWQVFISAIKTNRFA